MNICLSPPTHGQSQIFFSKTAYNQRIAALRTRQFRQPLGVDKPVHKEGDDLTDPFDSDGFFIAGQLVSSKLGIGGLASAHRVNPVRGINGGPINKWLNGIVDLPANRLEVSRAATMPAMACNGLYGFGFSLIFQHAVIHNYKFVCALLLEGFPLRPFMQERMHFRELSRPITCNPGDGVEYRAVPVLHEVNSSTWNIAQKEILRVQNEKLRKLGLVPVVSKELAQLN